MQDDMPPAVQPRPSRTLRIALGVSLGFNLLVLGVLAGAVLVGPPERRSPPGLKEVTTPYVHAFDVADKRAMRKEMRDQLPPHKAMKVAHDADFAEFMALLRAPAFDTLQAREILERQVGRAARAQELGRRLAIDRLNQMSDTERLAYADRLENWRAARHRARTARD